MTMLGKAFGVVALGGLAFVAAGVYGNLADDGRLFTEAADVPAAVAPASSSQWAGAIERARPIVRAAIVEQNLPGVSVAVGSGSGIVWAEGFGWRDLVTHAPVTPETRFNIGTAAAAIPAAAVASFAMNNTGTDTAADWSPSHNGEPEDDFPLFVLIHDKIARPLGLADAAQPLPGDRATFYVPKFEDNNPRRGRRLMFMRDLACCGADGKSFYSTPSDLVRFALATNAPGVDGVLAGGSVLSLNTRPDKGLVVAVASHLAYADTAGLARRVADTFVDAR